MPNGVTQAYVYDNSGQRDSRLTSLTYKHGTTTIGNLSHTYDPNDRRTSVGGSLAAGYVPSGYYQGSDVYNADNALIDHGQQRVRARANLDLRR